MYLAVMTSPHEMPIDTSERASLTDNDKHRRVGLHAVKDFLFEEIHVDGSQSGEDQH
jgi:hypothetical protein